MGQPEQVVTPAAAGVQGAGIEQRADVPQGLAQGAVRLPLDQGATGIGRVKAKGHAHGGRLAGAVGADETGDLARPDREGEAIQGHGLAEAFAQVSHFDGRFVAHVIILTVAFESVSTFLRQHWCQHGVGD